MTPRRTTASLSAMLAVLVVLVVATGTQMSMTDAGGQVVAGAATEAECATLEVLLLMDESASLKTTDPQNRRVEAADVLVRSLSASAQAAGGSVNLTIAGFGSGTNEVGQAVLPAETGTAVELVQSFTTRTDERNTDYVLALLYATDHFTQRPTVPIACKRLVWFTDGAYSIDDTSAPGIATYTSSTQKAAIEGQFEGQICGDLPPESRLTTPVSAQIRAAGFVVQLVDFRAEGGETAIERQERAATDRVITRLLTGDGSDPCRVPGERVEAGQATALADEFFTQGQIALGRRPVACADLSTGFPSPLVQAASARGNPGTTITIRRDGTDVASGDGFASYTAPADAPTPGAVSVASSGGPVIGCYADLAASVAAAGTGTVIQGAPSGLVGVAVRGGAEPGDSATMLGPDAVSVAATVDGAPAGVEWQEATRTWQVALPGPIAAPPSVVVTASTPGWGDLSSADIPVVLGDAPPLPSVVWGGPTTVEGSGTFPGRLDVVPSAVTGGQVCVTFGEPQSATVGVAIQLSTLEACGPDDEPFSVAADLVVDGERNGPVELALPFTASFRAAGTAEAQTLDGTGQVTFPTITATKAADASTTALITVVLVLLSALLPLALLLILANVNRRLPDPSGRRVATFTLVAEEGALDLPSGAGFSPDHVTPLVGTRSSYELPLGLAVTRRATLNPFAEASVEVTSERGPVTAVPWMRIGQGRTLEVPSRFEHLVLLRSEPGKDTGRAIVVIPAEATDAETEQVLHEALQTTNRLWDRVNTLLSTRPGR